MSASSSDLIDIKAKQLFIKYYNKQISEFEFEKECLALRINPSETIQTLEILINQFIKKVKRELRSR